MILEKHPEIQHLSPSEKLILVGEIWDDLATQPAKIPENQQIIAELQRRAEEYRQNPHAVVRWEDAKNRILSSKPQ